MITRITIQSESAYSSAESAYKDKLTITRTSVRYEYEPLRPSPARPPKKWTVSSHSDAFAAMFRNLTEEVEDIMGQPEKENLANHDRTTFTLMDDSGEKRERTLTEGEEVYAVAFTIIDQMVKKAERETNEK